LFLSADFLALFIFPLFLSTLERKGEKINDARSSAKKNRSIVWFYSELCEHSSEWNIIAKQCIIKIIIKN